MRKALAVGCGGLNGAYGAGAVAELGRQFGPRYFDAVYASSVGVYAAAFFVAGQPNTCENAWRNLVDGKKLVNFWNPIRGRAILDLEYLTEIFQDKRSYLDTRAVFIHNIPLIFTATEYSSGSARYLKPNSKNIFTLMTASTAVPFMHGPVKFEDMFYIDGGLSDPLPIAKACADGYEQIVAVSNKPAGTYVGKFHDFFRFVSTTLPPQIARLVETHKNRMRAMENLTKKDSRIVTIQPKRPLPLHHSLDTDKDRINEAITMGVEDAHSASELLRKLNAGAR